ncbi:MAG: hypothetical protein PHZ19_02485 [Candidatus Thermoplasmatota archaeon]|nr:hypothetical protein [Candidatus Thermoplasmatota archaeon]
MENLGVLVAKLQADVAELKKGLQEGRAELNSFRKMAQDAGAKVKQALTFVGLGVGIYELGGLLKNAFQSGVKAVDDFRVSTISIAATLTDLAKPGQGDMREVFARNKEYAEQMYRAITLESAKHFATANEGMIVYNRLVQGGYAARMDEVGALLTLTDKIKLATKGQDTERQLNTELMALMEGQVRQGSLMAMELKSRLGPGWADVVEKHKQAGDLVSWLASLYPGLTVANKEIEGTLNAQWATTKSLLEILSIQGLGGAYEDIVGWVQEINTYLKEHGKELSENLQTGWNAVKEVAAGVVVIVQAIASWIKTAWGYTEGLRSSLSAIAKQRADMGVTMGLDVGPGLMEPSEKAAQKQAAEEAAFGGYEEAGEGLRKPYSGKGPTTTKPPAKDAGGGGGGRGGGKESADNLLSPYLAMLKAKRDADLEDAKRSLDLLKETNSLKRSELQRALAAQELDGRTYYLRLQELNQADTTAALALIAKKRQAQQQAYQESLAQMDQDQKLSEEAKGIARQKLEAENRKALLAIDAEAAKAKLEGERKVTEELTRQANLRSQYEQKAEDLNLETAELMGAVTEQEAKLQRLYLEWQRAKQAAILAGADMPDYLQALDANYQAKKLDATYGGGLRKIGASFRNLFSDVANAIFTGGDVLNRAFEKIFSDLMNVILAPAFNAIEQIIVGFFTSIFQNILGSPGMPWAAAPATGGATGGSGGTYSSYFAGGWRSFWPFAEGGVALQPIMGMVAEAGPEAIIPLDQLDALMGAGRVTLNLNVINNTRQPVQASMRQTEDSIDLVLDEAMAGVVERQGRFAKSLTTLFTTQPRLNQR